MPTASACGNRTQGACWLPQSQVTRHVPTIQPASQPASEGKCGISDLAYLPPDTPKFLLGEFCRILNSPLDDGGSAGSTSRRSASPRTSDFAHGRDPANALASCNGW